MQYHTFLYTALLFNSYRISSGLCIKTAKDIFYGLMTLEYVSGLKSFNYVEMNAFTEKWTYLRRNDCFYGEMTTEKWLLLLEMTVI